MTDAGYRPSPEALLKEAESESRGKLKIFLGAAPGVGKTYAMLGAAKARLSDGIDAVIGIVETHQRSETQALAQGIESVPMQKLDYRGLGFEEMDLDAILKRKPQLVLVDELAHTNIPGARHPKRYQDVQEILESGIDVYTTLNVQHIESLNDIVAYITGVKVRETVPDNIVQLANAIELIDLPPDELLQRLKEGKVYIPEQARLASHRFFTPGNLTALRELALRQAADRVDEQMTTYMRRHAISGPWPTSSRVMVCVSGDNQAAALVRAARRSAERRQTPWLVLYIETSHHSQLAEKTRNDIAQAMQLAESLGAETMTVTGEDIPFEILRIAREHNVSTIIIGKTSRSSFSRFVRPSVAETLLKQGEGFDILLVNNAEPSGHSVGTHKAFLSSDFPLWKFHKADARETLFVIGFTSLVALVFRSFMPPAFLPFLYTLAVFLVALDLDLVPSLCAVALSVIAQDLFLTAPHVSFFPSRSEDAQSLLYFLVLGVSISMIGARLHRQIKVTRANAERTQALYDFTKSIAAAATIDDVAQATARRVAGALGARVAVLLPKNERLEVVAAVPADLKLDTASNAAMDWAWRHRKPAGFHSDTLPGAAFYGLPLQSGATSLGVLAVRTEDGSALTSSQNHFLTSLAYQSASAIERAKLVTDVAQARLQSETEKLRASLLSSISRDLRAPLDSIIFTVQSLNKSWNETPPDEQRALVGHIEQESDRLDRFVENLLDMTELVAGGMRFHFQPTQVRDLIDKALTRLARRVKERVVNLDCAQDLPLIEADGAALHRVFVNVIENACSYSTPDEPIHIAVWREGSDIKITITDRGPGIPESERQNVFDMFYRIKKSDAVTGPVEGVGLGLSICRGFIEAHQGRINAQSGESGIGTSIIIRLPISGAAH
ncbi:MAG: sensor histidine kinase KdpD [Alphaproteobacteria bacterium]|nr:sensor histidine kinase KdpD [Alphaproteobacteria bacterium]